MKEGDKNKYKEGPEKVKVLNMDAVKRYTGMGFRFMKNKYYRALYMIPGTNTSIECTISDREGAEGNPNTVEICPTYTYKELVDALPDEIPAIYDGLAYKKYVGQNGDIVYSNSIDEILSCRLEKASPEEKAILIFSRILTDPVLKVLLSDTEWYEKNISLPVPEPSYEVKEDGRTFIMHGEDGPVSIRPPKKCGWLRNFFKHIKKSE